MKTEIVIIKDRKVLGIEPPPETKIFQGDRALNVDFDIVSVGGEMFLTKHVLEMASRDSRGSDLSALSRSRKTDARLTDELGKTRRKETAPGSMPEAASSNDGRASLPEWFPIRNSHTQPHGGQTEFQVNLKLGLTPCPR